MNDLKKINNVVSDSKIDSIYYSPEKIIFPEQYNLMNIEKIVEELLKGIIKFYINLRIMKLESSGYLTHFTTP